MDMHFFEFFFTGFFHRLRLASGHFAPENRLLTADFTNK